MNSDRIAIVNALAIQKAQYATDQISPAMVIRYIGPNASGKITVAADGNLEFVTGAVGAEAADTDVVAATGIIDVSGATMNTFGEVVDIINASGTWQALLIGALRTDSSDNVLVAQAVAQAKSNYGVKVYFDSGIAIPISLNISAKAWEVQKGVDGNPWSPDELDYINSLIYWRQLNTFDSGVSNINVYEVDKATNRETLIYTEPTAATTVVGTRDFSAIGNGWGLCAAKGCDLVVRMLGADHTTGYLGINGASRKFGY